MYSFVFGFKLLSMLCVRLIHILLYIAVVHSIHCHIPFGIIFHCMNISLYIYPFFSWWTLGCFQFRVFVEKLLFVSMSFDGHLHLEKTQEWKCPGHRVGICLSLLTTNSFPTWLTNLHSHLQCMR